MTRLVFVHGMKNENQNADELRNRWHEALREGWRRAGIAEPSDYGIEMPYYGQVLHELTDGAISSTGKVSRSGASDIGPDIGEFEVEYYRLLQDQLNITDAEVRAELDLATIERGPANWEWVQAIARTIEKKYESIGDYALKCVPQVDGYLGRPSVRKAVDDIVEPTLMIGRTVIVAHSLGSIVTYLLLKKNSGHVDIPLFMTLGSPLGISTVVRNIRPIFLPERIETWINGADERDYVALTSRLSPPTYPSHIQNISDLRNDGDDKHSISEYLKQTKIAQAIGEALS